MRTAPWTGFSVTPGETRHRPFRLLDQWIDDDIQNPGPLNFQAAGSPRPGLFLAAPKITNALALVPAAVPSGVRVDLDEDPHLGAVGRRAALISATFILIYRAAERLDVDPDEFELIQPRTFLRPDGTRSVMLQFSDALINGSGLCDWLAAEGPSGRPAIAEILRSIVADPAAYPRAEFETDVHKTSCDRSCYLCLSRFSNQAYHGLLDWRLGLDVLALLEDGSFVGGDQRHGGSTDWLHWAHRYAIQVGQIAGSSESHELDGLPVVRVDTEADAWMAVVHPLSDWPTLVATNAALAAFMAEGHSVYPRSSFDLARRPVSSVEWARLRHQGGP